MDAHSDQVGQRESFPDHRKRDHDLMHLCRVLDLICRCLRDADGPRTAIVPVRCCGFLNDAEAQQRESAEPNEIALLQIGSTEIPPRRLRPRELTRIYFKKNGTVRVHKHDMHGLTYTWHFQSWRRGMKEIFTELVHAYALISKRSGELHDMTVRLEMAHDRRFKARAVARRAR